MRVQPRLKKGKREPLWAALAPAVKQALRRDAAQSDCSTSWMGASILATYYEIDIPLPYEGRRKRRAA